MIRFRLPRHFSFRALLLGAALTLSTSACDELPEKPAAREAVVHPHLMYRPEHKEIIRARVGREPYATMLTELRTKAAAEPREPLEVWDVGVWSENAHIAQANAVLAWVFDDKAAAEKAKTLLLTLDTDWDSNEHLDINIGMPRVLISYVNAWDLLSATPWFTPEESAEAERRILEVTDQFSTRFLDNPFFRIIGLVVTRNNHPIRTLAAFGYVALAFPHHYDADRWLNWAVSDIADLLGPDGKYVQADGGISEGPFYGQFALGPALPFLIAVDNTQSPQRLYERICKSRNPLPPWDDQVCVEGEPFVFENPLHSPLLRKTAEWLTAVRLPSGLRAHVNDSKTVSHVASVLLTGFGGEGYLLWDWLTGEERPMEMHSFFYLAPWYLAYVDDTVAAQPPAWKNRFFPDTGQAVFRSGWEADDLWFMLVGDHGAARRSIHNHADGTAFALYGYGEPLLIDTGYYKPNPLDNPVTMNHPSHNVVLVDGKGGPIRGLLNSWGDTDAFLENLIDGERIAWGEARMQYEGITVRRGVAFVRERYFVVADRIASEVASARDFQWRSHLWAGFDVGGAFAVTGQTVQIFREKGSLDAAVTSTVGAPIFVEPPYVPLKAPHVHQLLEQEIYAADHAVVDATVHAVAPDFLAVLAPYRTDAAAGSPDGRLTVTSLSAVKGAAWLVKGAWGEDVVWLREAGAPGTLQIPGGPLVTTDAQVAIAAVDGSFGLVADGSQLRVGSTTILDGDKAPIQVKP